MKKSITIFWVTCILFSSASFAQVTAPNNDNLGQRFVGFDNTDVNPLPIRNDADADINIWRNNIQKFRISEQASWSGLNGAFETNVQRTTLGLNGENNLAWSMFHLWEGNLNNNMYRNWLNVGTSYTGNADFMYCGLMDRPTDGPSNLTDAVLAWGCQNQPGYEDYFRILFLTPTTGDGASSSSQGLETVRITPLANVGIGDFSTMPEGLNGGGFPAYGQPHARLDVQYFGDRPEGNRDIGLNVRNIARHETGTADDKYGIYSYSENYYEEIFLTNFGGHFWAKGGRQPIGIRGIATRDQVFYQGVRAIGVDGRCTEEVPYSANIGVSGYASNDSQNGTAYGVYGFSNASINSNHWAGYFNGRVYSSVGYSTSDENLKQNINPIENAIEILSQIESKTYNFDPAVEALNLEEGICYGVIAQQLEEVLPELVTEVTSPAGVDENGEEIESLTFKAVRYQDLIPILIAGFNEQSQVIAAQDSLTKSKNDDIEELENKIQKLEEQLNSISGKMQKIQQDTDDCCNLKNQTQSGGSTEDNSGNQLKLEQNVPNPFQERTRIDFEIPENAQVKLEITDKVGKVVEVLMEGNLQSGTYSTTWNGNSHASGVYYYSLYANGQLLTKKMIKQ